MSSRAKESAKAIGVYKNKQSFKTNKAFLTAFSWPKDLEVANKSNGLFLLLID